ncbi:MAG: ATP:cob(I)alamin adenosyltransferase [Planctomycetes bacterium]|nr:ATP:cob(I)alamin adenosyltransferase [Planctomycetota bacterium]HNZ66089.1 ATP:cob(I)alamin adenosyltransferase [Planctomycetota bacterium]HPY75812.1 ATP:cob(I)alamin adenosyltransferase [Planctomycetota bacterium]HQB00316.1 ATP:cob(I)alamin adenosyltransferase [Planctomycetota bacterium]
MKTISITTKQGDSGHTSTLSGEIVEKHDIRVEIPGLIDELLVYLASIKIEQKNNEEIHSILTWLQHCLFLISAQASDPFNTKNIPQIQEKELHFLDILCTQYERSTNMPEQFILSANTKTSCQYDFARVQTRKVERKFSLLSSKFPNHKISIETFAFLNRLSDFLFILARKEEKNNYDIVDYSYIKNFPKKYQN